VESGNEYVLQVKGNQPNLLKAIKHTLLENTAVDKEYDVEKNTGRHEYREVYVYSRLNNPVYKQWYGIKIILVVSKGTRNNKEYTENRYYLSSTTLEKAMVYKKGYVAIGELKINYIGSKM
jgi:hypothetical protein